MVRVTLFRGKDGSLRGYVADGHAGFSEEGTDIVCAAVSALAIVTVMGLQVRLGLSPEVYVDDERGYLECRLDREDVSDALWVRAQDLLETFALGIREMVQEYGAYVQVEEEEVAT